MKRSIIFVICSMMFMFLMTACGSNTSGGVSSKPTSTSSVYTRQVHVTLTDSTITSSMTTFQANVPYDFIVTNKGHSPHDFIIRRRIQGPATAPQADQGVLHIVDSAQLPPGATQQFTYAFTQANAQSSVQFTEHLAGPGAAQGPHIPVQIKQG